MGYTNSPLVSYTKISPNKTKNRNHAIDTLTIHCYVGQVSVESAASWFGKITTMASCNYFIGTDGRVALIVEEKDRSWCSSNSANDHRAITIECACDETHPYAVNDKVYNTLIELCADICKRNNIKKLLWKGNKSLIGQVDKQNMTVHRWFKNKACPGEYLYNRHGEIATKVNEKLNTSTSSTTKPITPQKVNVTYAVKLEGGRILPAVKNLSDYAGIENKKITDIAIKVDKGSVKYQVHVLGGGWLPWVTGYNWNDHNNGYAGNGKPIDAIRVYYNTPSNLVKNGGYREAKYRVSRIGSTGYYDWQLDDVVNKSKGMDGYAGAFGKAIDKFQVCIE